MESISLSMISNHPYKKICLFLKQEKALKYFHLPLEEHNNLSSLY